MHGDIKPPVSWPEPPLEMSVSSLRAIESCPRKWALSSASYPDLWRRRGYPPRIQPSWIMGGIVHLAVQRVVGSLARANCASLSDPRAPAVIKELGGFTSVIRSCIDDTIARQTDNPRSPNVTELRMSLENSISRMRADIQGLLRTVPLVAAFELRDPPSHLDERVPLGPGAYPELEVRAPHLGWRGTIDLLVLEPGVCEIRDFKTGESSDEYKFQVRAYSALWSADGELNPSGRLATKLTISYAHGDVAVPALSTDETVALRDELLERAVAARQLAKVRPPEARPSLDSCRRCDVRHLCSVYWETDTQHQLAAESDVLPPLGDLQVRVLSRRGPVTWDAVAQQSDRFGSDEPLVLLAHGGQHAFEDGVVLRILDARLLAASRDGSHDLPDLPVASLTSASEVYTLQPVPRI